MNVSHVISLKDNTNMESYIGKCLRAILTLERATSVTVTWHSDEEESQPGSNPTENPLEPSYFLVLKNTKM